MDFTKTKLYGISNKKYLSELLHLDLSTLKRTEKYYEVKPFPKYVNGKKRMLYNPDIKHKNALKKIVKMLGFVEFPEYLCGGIPEVSYVTNAGRHLNKKNLLLLDITDFFPSTKDSYVYDFFKNTLKQSEDIAKIMVNLTTAKRLEDNTRFLPQGYSTSPMLSFFSYYRMYEELNKFAIRNNYTFSAYYDDFSFSSEKFIQKSKKREVVKIVNKYSLNVNAKKTKIIKINHTKITGVMVHKNILKAPKSLFKKTHEYFLMLLDMDYNTENYTKEDFIDICNKLQGCLSAIQSIERERNLEYYKNKLKYVRKKYDIPIEKSKKDISFKNIEVKD